jgi:hypothetical protein
MIAGLQGAAGGALTALAAAAYLVAVVGGLGFFLWRASRVIDHPEGVARIEVVTAAVASIVLFFTIAGGFFFFFALLGVGV